ncbi:hypothetical protein [Kribbella swartbergensis]
MAKVSVDGMEMDTDAVRTSGSSMAAGGAQFAAAAQQIIQRINSSEYAIGTGPTADNFHLGYNLPATDVKQGTESAARTLTDLGNSLIEEAGRYEEVDQRHRATLDRIRQA